MEVSPGRRCSGRQPTTARRRRRRSEANETAKTAESPANRVHAGLLLSWTYSHPPLPPPPMPRVGSTLTHSLISLSLAPLFSTFETQWSFEKKNTKWLWHTIYTPLSFELSPLHRCYQQKPSQTEILCAFHSFLHCLYISLPFRAPPLFYFPADYFCKSQRLEKSFAFFCLTGQLTILGFIRHFANLIGASGKVKNKCAYMTSKRSR